MKFFTSAAVAGVALLSLAAIPARGAVHQVTVGGTGILKYDPEFVVCNDTLSLVNFECS